MNFGRADLPMPLICLLNWHFLRLDDVVPQPHLSGPVPFGRRNPTVLPLVIDTQAGIETVNIVLEAMGCDPHPDGDVGVVETFRDMPQQLPFKLPSSIENLSPYQRSAFRPLLPLPTADG